MLRLATRGIDVKVREAVANLPAEDTVESLEREFLFAVRRELFPMRETRPSMPTRWRSETRRRERRLPRLLTQSGKAGTKIMRGSES